MTALLDPHTRDRLAKLLGLLGSDHDGERAAAAAKADALVRARGLTWREVIVPAMESTVGSLTTEKLINIASANRDRLSLWAEKFVMSIEWQHFRHGRLSPKQRAKLEEIVEQLWEGAE